MRLLKVDLHRPAQWRPLVGEWIEDPKSYLDISKCGSESDPVPNSFLHSLRHELNGRPFGSIWAVSSLFDGLDLGEWSVAGELRFEGSVFLGKVDALRASFQSVVRFDRAEFRSKVNFGQSVFSEQCSFAGAQFLDVARFRQASFAHGGLFVDCTFGGESSFVRSEFGGPLRFGRATIQAPMELNSVVVGSSSPIDLSAADIQGDISLLELVGADTAVSLRGSRVSGSPVAIRISTRGESVSVGADRLRLQSDTAIGLGSGCALTGGLIVRSPSAIEAIGPDDAGLVSSLDGADITAPFRIGRHVDLTSTIWGDQDLTRVSIADAAAFPTRRSGWLDGRRRYLSSDDLGEALDVRQLSILERNYRDLRRDLEGQGSAPMANDFYFGEMESRRRRMAWSSPEWWLLTGYRWISAYGTRAWSALVAWLLVTSLAAGVLMIGGFKLGTEPSAPDASYPGVWRFTLETSLSLLRPSQAPLASLGETFVLLSLRIIGPVLFGLAALSVRNRVKR